jgi:serine phosphatase RsbU (regulator of sigma subunit)/pSer/pThr/pTyr-binding forkhead associated (FHA) protein
MTAPARLAITDEQGRRTVLIDKSVFVLGRRTTADLQVLSRDTSREHAEIARDGEQWILRDRGSRFGTFVNDQPVTASRPLVHGDRIQLGRASGAEIVFLNETEESSDLRSVTGSSTFGQLAAVLNGLRALGSGRVLDEVLTLVLDSALEVTAADRGFVMLADAAGVLQFTTARAKGRQSLPGTTFETSHKIPREVFERGQTRIVGDLLEGDFADVHEGTIAVGIRHVICVPLLVVPLTVADQPSKPRPIGVLYLDGRERDALLSASSRSSLEAFAMQAALAIESARLYAESAEKAKLERDLRLAADIQRALLPDPIFATASIDLAAITVPCRTVGGDFYDYVSSHEGLGFTVGDVAGKGPSAALLASAVQSNFAAQAPVSADPADALTRINRALLRRAVDARFATMFYGVMDDRGGLKCSNGGQEPPVLVRSGRVETLDEGGPVLGLLPTAAYRFETTSLETGDLIVICSDGVTEAQNPSGEEFGRDRLVATMAAEHGQPPDAVLERLVGQVRDFAGNAAQTDDITAMVVRYKGKA